MSVGALKRILTLVNLLAVLGLGGTAYGFLSHRSAMATPQARPDFVPEPVRTQFRDQAKIDSVSMRLGRFPEPREATQAAVEQPVEDKVEDAISKLGSIFSALAFVGPYTKGGLQPTITFKLKNGNLLTICRGDSGEATPYPTALEVRPHPEIANFLIPVRYQFVGCEPDHEHEGGVFFLFDMKCDGTDIQKARWRGALPEEPAPGAPPTAEAKGKSYFGQGPSAVAETVQAGSRPEEKPAPVEIQPVEPAPVAPPPSAAQGFQGEIFEMEEGRLAPTVEAVEYLRENYQDVLKDARTRDYVDPSTNRKRGVQILFIERNSVANRFGLRRDDVILSINGRPVTSQAQAVNIVKEELRANKNVIEVKVLRDGDTIVNQYDTRDPATRRAARDAFRNRR